MWINYSAPSSACIRQRNFPEQESGSPLCSVSSTATGDRSGRKAKLERERHSSSLYREEAGLVAREARDTRYASRMPLHEIRKKRFVMAKNTESKISNPQSLRVLMVEDSEDDALLEIRELKKGGYNPVYERVETAAAMKKTLKEKQWDIILCDYKLTKF